MTARADRMTLQVLVQGADSIRVTPFKEGSALESTVKTSRTCPFNSALVADRAREILGLLARANAGAEGLLDELLTSARAIWVDLLPAFLKEKLAEAVGGNLLLHLDRPLLGIPWELLHDGDEFLGRRFRIGRLVTMDGGGGAALQRSMRAPLSVLVVADPSGDLPAAREEAVELGEILEDAPAFGSVTMLMGNVSTRAFRDALARHDVLHYAGHAETRGPSSYLRLADGEMSTDLLEQLRGRVDFPGLVFLNACGSAEDTVRLSQAARPAAAGAGASAPGAPGAFGAAGADAGAAAGLASCFLMCGARHVVGTLWEVRDEVARQFAGAFYRSLGRGDSIGEAMAAGRDRALERWGLPSLLWTAHLLYGDPTWRSEPASNLLDDDLSVLDGLEARYRADLDSDDAAQRLLAAAMLLRLGDRRAASAVGRDLATLATWISGDATEAQRRQASLVVAALASAAGLESPADVDPTGSTLPDMNAVTALLARLGVTG